MYFGIQFNHQERLMHAQKQPLTAGAAGQLAEPVLVF